MEKVGFLRILFISADILENIGREIGKSEMTRFFPCDTDIDIVGKISAWYGSIPVHIDIARIISARYGPTSIHIGRYELVSADFFHPCL